MLRVKNAYNSKLIIFVYAKKVYTAVLEVDVF